MLAKKLNVICVVCTLAAFVILASQAVAQQTFTQTNQTYQNQTQTYQPQPQQQEAIAQPKPEADQGYKPSLGNAPESEMQTGYSFEQSGQWAEALSHYQRLLKEFPADQTLVRRRAISRIYFDLDRRYSDGSFMKTIASTDGAKALNVYAEVLLKIQSYYVDEPDWNKLAQYGLASLEVALNDQQFKHEHLNGVSDESIQQAVKIARERLDNYQIRSRHDVYVIANSAAKFMNSNLGVPAQATIYEFVCGAISALDPYSAFMSSNQYSETMSQIEGNFVGLGVELRTHSDHLEIVSVIKGGSASLGGIAEGDQVIAVDGRNVSQIGSEKAADMLRGVEGSFVSVSIDRGSAPQTLRLERRRVEIPSVDQVGIVDSHKGVGYIRLTNFQKTTARDFDAALWKLHREGMRSLIVDVRGNPGGLLSASVEVADRFVGSGVIVSTRGRNPMEDYTHRAKRASTWLVPLVVLVDSNSASASEIFAAAIRDHRRGTIVGERSYGKGSVQGIFPLNVSGGGVRLTTAKFYSPTGKPISQVGVSADVEVHRVAKAAPEIKSDDDPGMRVAVEVARRAIDQRGQAKRQSVAGR